MSLYEGYARFYRAEGKETSKPTFDRDTTRLYLGLKRSVDALEKDVRGQVYKEQRDQLNATISLASAMAQVQSREFTAQEALSGRLLDGVRSDRMKFEAAYNKFNANTAANIVNAINRSGLTGTAAADALEQELGIAIAGDPEGLGRNDLQRAALLRNLLERTGSTAIIKNAQGRYELGPQMAGREDATKKAFQEYVNTMNRAEDLNTEFGDFETAVSKQVEDVTNRRSGAISRLQQVGNQYKGFTGTVEQSLPSAQAAADRLGELDFAREKYFQDATTLKVIEESLLGGGRERTREDIFQDYAKNEAFQTWAADRKYTPPPVIVDPDTKEVRGINRPAMFRAIMQYKRERRKPQGEYIPRANGGVTNNLGQLVIQDAETGETRRLYGERLMTHANDPIGSVRLRFVDPDGEAKDQLFKKGEYTAWDGQPAPVEQMSFRMSERARRKSAEAEMLFRNKGLTARELANKQAPVQAVQVDGMLYAVSGEGGVAEVFLIDPQTGTFVEVADDVAAKVRPVATKSGQPMFDGSGALVTPEAIKGGVSVPEGLQTKSRDDAKVREQILEAAGLEDAKPLEETIKETNGRSEAQSLEAPARKTVLDRVDDVMSKVAGVIAPKSRETEEAPRTEAEQIEQEFAREIEAEKPADQPARSDADIMADDDADEPDVTIPALKDAPEAPEAPAAPAPTQTADEAMAAAEADTKAAAADMATTQRERDKLIENLARMAATTEGIDVNKVNTQIEAIRRGDEGSMVAGARALTEGLKTQDIEKAKREAAAQFAANRPETAPKQKAKDDGTATQAEIVDAISGDALTDEPAKSPPPTIPDQQSTGPVQRADEPRGVRKARERKQRREARKQRRESEGRSLSRAFREAIGRPKPMTPAVASLAASNMGMLTPGQEAESPQAINAAQRQGMNVKLDDEDETPGGVA